MEAELQELGLSENETQVYLTLLKTGPLTSYALSKKTNLSRGYLYELLDKLHKKGIISEISIEGKKHYQAAPPKQLISLLQYKLENLQSILPKLEKIKNQWKEETKIDVFRGKYAYKTLLKDVISTIKTNSEVLTLGIDEKILMSLEPTYLKRYFSLSQKKKVKEKVLVKEGTKPLQQAKFTKYKYLPEAFIGKVVQFIYENKVAILTLSEPLNLIIIEDKEIASTYRTQFNIFWKIAKN